MLPAMVILQDALNHDIAVMADYAAQQDVSLAPHGKTTMSPQIWDLQLRAGAWAITVATAWQARVAAMSAVPRIFIANEVVDPGSLDWIGGILDDPDPELICQADSVAAVERMSRHLGERRRPLPVLVEMGMPGGRTGARTGAEAGPVIDAIVAAPGLRLAGVTCYEGVAPGATAHEKDAAVADLLAGVREVAMVVAELAAHQGAREIILTGGGSVHFQSVVVELSKPLDAALPVRVVIRSGAAVAHDHGYFDDASPFGANAAAGAPRLVPALEVWAPVLSTPERGLAIAGAGKRDLPYDIGLPKPIKLRRDGEDVALASGLSVTRLDDQHAYLALEPTVRLAVGDLVGFGISHPCSAFDRWRAIPVVDDHYAVIDVFETLFQALMGRPYLMSLAFRGWAGRRRGSS